MGFRPPKKLPQFADLKGVLSQSKQTDNALYQTVQILIDRLVQFQGVNSEQIAAVNTKVDELGSQAAGSSGDATKNASYLTKNNETAGLPNSIQLLAGVGITLDYSVPNQLTISSSGGSEWSVLTNGDIAFPELIFAGGDVIMTHTP